MRAIDVMTSEVVTVDETASVQAAAKLMAERSISAVPVVDRGRRVIGMVSEGDLLHRAETGTERRRAWRLDMLSSTNQLAADYVKSHADKVKDAESVAIRLVRPGEDRREAVIHLHYGLLAEILAELARSLEMREPLDEPHRAELAEAAKGLAASLEPRADGGEDPS
jgi:CBS-domain-containing membrane protein